MSGEQRPSFPHAIPIVAALAVIGVVAALGGVADPDGSTFDRWLLLLLRAPGDPGMAIGPEWLRGAMTDITALGGGPVLTLFVLIAAGGLIARGQAGNALLLGAGTASGGWLVDQLKACLLRPRPALVDHFVAVDSASYPSAHAANSALVYLMIAGLAVARARDTERHYAWTASLLLTFIIGSSRVYLGVHWPGDVIAGWMFGGAWAAIWLTLARWRAAVTDP